MQIIVMPDGQVRCVYSEEIDIAVLGNPTIIRASTVEPDPHGQWWADLSPVGGPMRGPFTHRSEAIVAERQWLALHWLESGQ